MRFGVGYSDNPDTAAAGIQAVSQALDTGKKTSVFVPCDMILLFSTARHDAKTLRNAIASVVGEKVPIVGGGAVGGMTADTFGYAGDQVVLAAMWFENGECRIFSEGGLDAGEDKTGARLGEQLAQADCTPDTPMMLFYDAIERNSDGMRLLLATYLLRGLESGLGYIPNSLVGAGFQGDYTCSPTRQWIGRDIAQYNALALVFPDSIRIDSAIIHGCRPSTGYYTVTKAEDQVILEINGEPALPFIQRLLGPGIRPEEYAFFLIFGINSGDKWADFDENNYANRLCLGIDRERNGIIMFEPDMVPGTEFQIMHRSIELGYVTPKIDNLFARLEGRKPVFSFYIDCAGRAAGYAGLDLEDVLAVQKAIAGRTPFMGIYSGVEIAPVSGVPRALDWTGVFCLFSVKE